MTAVAEQNTFSPQSREMPSSDLYGCGSRGRSSDQSLMGQAALVRELHVYGSIVPLGEHGEGEDRQHRSYGQKLLSRAEDTARNAGYDKVAVMSGVGVRPYYRKQGYVRTGPYMIKNL